MADDEHRMDMRQMVRALIAFGIALIIVFAMRAYMFTIYTVPSDISGMLRRGDRVMVNRLSHADLRVGDWVVFNKGESFIGRVEALPGDTMRVGGRLYAIPMKCCDRCLCPDCKLYLLNLGPSRTLVYKHQMVGKAHRLFHLPF